MKTQEHTYRPLPKNLTIKQSPIEGLGLFVKDEIVDAHGQITIEFPVYYKAQFIGMTHIQSSVFNEDEFHFQMQFSDGADYPDSLAMISFSSTKDKLFLNGLIRTPLGGFINHSDNPNVELRYMGHGCWGIIATKNILPGEEITCDYKYTPCGVIKESEKR